MNQRQEQRRTDTQKTTTFEAFLTTTYDYRPLSAANDQLTQKPANAGQRTGKRIRLGIGINT